MPQNDLANALFNKNKVFNVQECDNIQYTNFKAQFVCRAYVFTRLCSWISIKSVWVLAHDKTGMTTDAIGIDTQAPLPKYK